MKNHSSCATITITATTGSLTETASARVTDDATIDHVGTSIESAVEVRRHWTNHEIAMRTLGRETTERVGTRRSDEGDPIVMTTRRATEDVEIQRIMIDLGDDVIRSLSNGDQASRTAAHHHRTGVGATVASA